jgi:signal transduction histidine kinase
MTEPFHPPTPSTVPAASVSSDAPAPDQIADLPGLADAIGQSEMEGSLGRQSVELLIHEMRRLVALREHTVLSLSELSQELTISLDLFSLADLVLFNLMGQFGTSRSAMWLSSDQNTPILVRSHGIPRSLAKALGPVCTVKLLERLGHQASPLALQSVEEVIGPAATRLAQRADIAVFAPIRSRDATLGLVALGPRIGGEPYGPTELQALQASLGMVGVAIQNMSFYSRLVESNRKLRMSNEELEHLDRLKSEFLSNVNHELRTPLTCIMAYVDTLLGARHDPELVQDFLKVVMVEAQRLQGLLENLLAFSALTQQKMSLHLVTGDVSLPLARYFEERLPGVSEGLRELVYHRQSALPMARFDEKRMLQIVDVLIDNAVKFTPEGSRIDLRVTSFVEDEGAWVRISVQDDGPGVPAERIPELFESFRQADGSSTRSVGGMGIGLSIARQLAHAMGGRLTANSDLGKGSTFSLDLPVA